MRFRGYRSGVVLWLGCLLASASTARAGAPPPEEPRPAPRIEVAFALDATGSMGPYISEAREKIRAIAADLATGTPKPDVRFGLVTYRDRGDDYVTKVHAFTHDVEQMHRDLDATDADGGGDEPESVLEGVRDALTKLAWSPPSDAHVIRLVYVVGDAPPHHYAETPTEQWVSAEARRRHIVIHGIVCAASMPEFEAMARHTEGRIYELRGTSSDHFGAAVSGAGALAGALTDATKAYSTSIGVSFDGKDVASISSQPLSAPAVPVSGLVGAHVRWIRDEKAWRDLWAAHTSLLAAALRPPAPSVDFGRYAVLALGGRNGGLELEKVFADKGRRAVRVKPAATPEVRFVLVPSIAAAEGK